MINEKQLLKEIKLGKRKAYKALYELYADRLYRFLMQFTNDRDTSEEWVQRAFIKAFNNIDSFRMDSKFGTWLFRIALNEMRTDFRKQKEQLSINENEIELNEEIDNNFEWEDYMRVLLNDLDDSKKMIFILFEVEGYSHSEIAEMLDISTAVSRTTLSRTKKILQQKILESKGEL